MLGTWSWHGSHDPLVVGFARCVQAVDTGMPAKAKTPCSMCNTEQHVVVVVVVCWDVFVGQRENMSLICCCQHMMLLHVANRHGFCWEA